MRPQAPLSPPFLTHPDFEERKKKCHKDSYINLFSYTYKTFNKQATEH